MKIFERSTMVDNSNIEKFKYGTGYMFANYFTNIKAAF